MRQITVDSLNAFVAGKPFKKSNMEVEVTGHLIRMKLFGNTIATYDQLNQELMVTDAGWKTVTTKERLNAVLRHFLGCFLYQENFVWKVEVDKNKSIFFGQLDGKWIPLKEQTDFLKSLQKGV